MTDQPPVNQPPVNQPPADQPPADWYTDPEDDSQYRYWDGSAWTEHRAPRHDDASDGPDIEHGSLRGPGVLIGNSFSLARRKWKGLALAALLTAAGQIAVVLTGIVTLDRVLAGELSEIWARVTAPDFDAESPEQQAYFESLEFDFSVSSFLPLAVGLLIAWVAHSVTRAVVMRLAMDDLHGRQSTVADAFRQSLARVPRLMGVDLQIWLLAVSALVVIGLSARAAPALLILLIPGLIAAVILLMAVIQLAYVVAAVGPPQASLRYAARLVRDRFWKALGRMLLVVLVVIAVSAAVGMVFGLPTVLAEQLWVLSQVVQAFVGAALGVVLLIASAILYYDLDGESDQAQQAD